MLVFAESKEQHIFQKKLMAVLFINLGPQNSLTHDVDDSESMYNDNGYFDKRLIEKKNINTFRSQTM